MIFLFLLSLWPLEESVVSRSVCKATAVGAAGPEKGWTRVSLLSWLSAGCSHGCSSENQSLNSQGRAVCFAWKSLCKVHLEVHALLPSLPEKSCDLLIGCQIHDSSADARSDFQVLKWSFITACVSGLEFRAKSKKKGLGLQTCFPSLFLLLGGVLNHVWCAGFINLSIRSVNVKVSTSIVRFIPRGLKLGDPNLRSPSVNLDLLLLLP